MSDGTERWLSEQARRALQLAAHGSWRKRADPDAAPLHWGLPYPEALPARDLARAAGEVLDREGAGALQYGGGDPAARFAERLRERVLARGFRRQGRERLITSGTTQGLDWVCRTLLDAGDVVGVEVPTFMGALRVFRRYGAALRGFPVEADGISVTALEAALTGGWRPKLLYVIPNFHNPTGVSLSGRKRRRLRELAAAYGFLLLEDDAYGELAFGDEPAAAMAMEDEAGVVLYLGTLSKTVAPGVRLGWLDVPVAMHEPLRRTRGDGGPNPFARAVVGEMLAAGDYARRVDALRHAYARRCRKMRELLARHMPEGSAWTRPGGGFFIWCRLPPGVDAERLAARAAGEGVLALPGRWFFPDEPAEQALRLSFSFADDATMERGIAALGTATRAEAAAVAESRTR